MASPTMIELDLLTNQLPLSYFAGIFFANGNDQRMSETRCVKSHVSLITFHDQFFNSCENADK